MKLLAQLPLSMFCALLFTGCLSEGTDSRVKNSETEESIAFEFNRDPQEAYEEMMKLSDFDKANMISRVMAFQGISEQTLQLFLSRGVDVPTNDSLRKELGRTALKIAVGSIDNAADYDDFVVFIHTGMLNGEEVSLAESYRFTLKELN